MADTPRADHQQEEESMTLRVSGKNMDVGDALRAKAQAHFDTVVKKYFDGNYSEYEKDRRARLGVDADQPHRIKYRSLTRA